VKKLPPSWTKSAPKQLSFESNLFAAERKEALFIERLLSELKNCKYLRYKTQFSKITVSERLNTYAHLDNVLQAGATLLYRLSKKTLKYKQKTEDDFLYEVFVERIDHPPLKEWTRAELIHHHDEVIARVNGMILANKDILKGNKAFTDKISDNLHASHIILQRL
jgi:hypothetical protein